MVYQKLIFLLNTNFIMSNGSREAGRPSYPLTAVNKLDHSEICQRNVFSPVEKFITIFLLCFDMIIALEKKRC